MKKIVFVGFISLVTTLAYAALSPDASTPANNSINSLVNTPIDCNYSIPPETTTIDNDTILRWSEKAIRQSFNFDYSNVDKQLNSLEACYTKEGWQAFSQALKKSDNVQAIKNQRLSANALVDGQGQINLVKPNEWKVSFPIQVIYQNDKDKMIQLLTVDVTVGRKPSGDLGITQIIANPRNPVQSSIENTNTTKP